MADHAYTLCNAQCFSDTLCNAQCFSKTDQKIDDTQVALITTSTLEKDLPLR